MATLEAVPPDQAETSGGSAPSPNDGVLLHPYLFSPVLKVPAKLSPSLKKQLAKQCSSKQGEEFIAELEQARSKLTTGTSCDPCEQTVAVLKVPSCCLCRCCRSCCLACCQAVVLFFSRHVCGFLALVILAALESPSVSDAAFNEAVNGYVALLLGLVAAGGGATNGAAAAPAADAAAAAAATPDEALAAAEGGAAASGASSSSLLGAPPSRLRHAIRWAWGEAVLAPPPGSQPRMAGAADAAYELASVLLAAALRLAHVAADVSRDSASGVPTPAATRSYRLLREAAGLLELVAGQLAPALPAELSADLDPQVGAAAAGSGMSLWSVPPSPWQSRPALSSPAPCPLPRQVVRALSSVALADAQQLTALRAVAKGNQASLIAALAADTAQLYEQACSQVGSAEVASQAECGAPKLVGTQAWLLPSRAAEPLSRREASTVLVPDAVALENTRVPPLAPVRPMQLGAAAAAGAASSKLWHYGQYKQAYCLAHAHAFNGIALWKADKPGQGLKSLEAAAVQLAAARRAAAAYDAAPPATLNLHHR